MLTNETDSDPELDLLGGDPVDDDLGLTGEANHALKTAPMFTGDACEAVGSTIFPQRALYARILESSTGAKVKSPKLFINTNAPFSGIVCGVQGSGKSHSTSVLLESCLICDKRLGTLPEPLSALLFHFDTAAGVGEVHPCEAACIASLEPSLTGNPVPPGVVVLVPANNITTMRRVYSRLPGVNVEPLHFVAEDLNGDRLLAMMKVDQDQHRPLYMESIMAIVRDMEPFSYEAFRRQLKEQKFVATQKAMLDQRLNILDSILEGGNEYNRVSRQFKKGQLTIIDLSAPFMDASSACGFFDIILGLFNQATTAKVGKLVVLDEAHKYLTNNGSSSRLTDSLLTVIREQRHLGTRVLISTQEPTVVPPSFLDLCSFVIAHRFSSPKWLAHLKEHISVEDAQWRSKVITLEPGEAMIFAPAALVLRQIPGDASPETEYSKLVTPLGQGYLKVRSRGRITADGGRSVLAVAEPSLYGTSVPGSIRSCAVSVTNSAQSQSLPSRSERDVNQERPRVLGDPDVGGNIPATAEASLYALSVPGSVRSRPESVANSVQSHNLSPKSEMGVDQERLHMFADAMGYSTSLPKTCLSESDGSRLPSPHRIPGGSSGMSATVPGMPADATILIQSPRNPGVETPQRTMAESLASSEPRSNTVPGRALTQSQAPETRFKHLISILKGRARQKECRVSFSELGTELKQLDPTLYTKLKDYLMEAEEGGIIKIGGENQTSWVQLLNNESQSYPREYAPLVKVMRAFLSDGESRPQRSDVAQDIYRLYPGTVKKFKPYISGAQDAGVVACRKGARLELVI